MKFPLRISVGGTLIDLPGRWQEELPDYPGRFVFRGLEDSTFSVNGTCMHLIAIEIDDESDIQEVKNQDFSEDLDHLWSVHQPDKGFQTSTIEDDQGKEREVIIYMLPHGR